ncbi:MAG: GGDEF domain-containing protein [Lachnospiraceae bacterium]|nr:GGDEF domain-containing protein [Lachnospiraceae bacterium]
MIFTKRKTIGVFISKMFKPFDDAFFKALEIESKRLDYDVVVFTTAGYYLTTSDYDIQEKNILKLAPTAKLDGIIAVPSTYEKGEFRNMMYEMLRKQNDCPLVLVREESDEFNCIYTDNNGAMRKVIKHLIEDHGLKNIFFHSGDSDNPEMDLRLSAFRQEMEEHGLSVPDNHIFPGNMWTNCGEKAYKAFFSDPDDKPEAVACANDYMAMGLIRVLRENGYRVPENVIVTGFDNVVDWCVDVPSLTTIQPDYSGMVKNAMELLDRYIREGENGDRPVRIGLKGELVCGESCGCGKRSGDYFRSLSERAIAVVENANDQDAAMNNMSIDLSASLDLKELHNVMISKRTENPIVRDHYICLYGTPDNLPDEESDKICLVHAIKDHKDMGMPMICYNRRSLLPLMAERDDEAQVFYLKLLHQNDHNFGYSIFHYDEGEFPSRCFVQTNVLLSIALENIRRNRELMMLYEERRLSSITDMQTGLLNRRGFLEQIEPIWNTLIGTEIAFICFDLDNLKMINDTYGHAGGDYAINLIGSAIHEALKPGMYGARVGGDEFTVFIQDASDGAAERYLKDFEKALFRLNRENDSEFEVSASGGFAVVKLSEKDTIKDCVKASDRELYKVKTAKKSEEE